MSEVAAYFLGLPAWAFPGWNQRYFTDKPTRLASYARVFNTVEGNTTFYRVPDVDTVKRWRDAVDGTGFRFCFKLPREVTHEKVPDMRALERFLVATDELEAVTGPLLLQFPATFGPDRLDAAGTVFDALDGRRRFAIEVRHPAFFDKPERLEPVLEQYSAGRVVLDSRPLYEGDQAHPDVLDALHRKPDVRVDPVVHNDVAFVRLILHPDFESNRHYIDEWAEHVAGYIRRGVETYMMIHCPNNVYCPPLGREFHETLRTRLDDLAPLPAWPIPEQLSLV